MSLHDDDLARCRMTTRPLLPADPVQRARALHPSTCDPHLARLYLIAEADQLWCAGCGRKAWRTELRRERGGLWCDRCSPGRGLVAAAVDSFRCLFRRHA